jgi:undecaprenyl-diphosphatase
MMTELFKAIFLGLVEGVTEWLPISSTGHMILVDAFIALDMSAAFKDMFLVVVQLGAILAVVILYWGRLVPVTFSPRLQIKADTLAMWLKIAAASIPAAVVGLLWEDVFTAWFYNEYMVSVMLILFGVVFIVVENRRRGQDAEVNSIAAITFRIAFIIGIFQMIAAVFPGTSRSGATIVGALVIGVSRVTAAEFTFFLAIPAMFGASALKLVKFGLNFTGEEVMILLAGTVTAFVVSILAIKFLLGYIKKHDFKVFGWYRIILGSVILLFSLW